MIKRLTRRELINNLPPELRSKVLKQFEKEGISHKLEEAPEALVRSQSCHAMAVLDLGASTDNDEDEFFKIAYAHRNLLTQKY